MARYTRDVLDRIRGLTDIVELVSGYFPLRKVGRNFTACCPFHEEKTPSFNVNPSRQIFKCFGCGEGGDVFGFVMQHDRIEFGEAVELLAGRCGVTLEQERGQEREFTRRDLYRAHEWATGVYRQHFLAAEGERARRYVQDRGITRQSADVFGLGYAPPGGRNLVDRAAAAGFSQRLLEAAGLASPRTRGPGLQDRFWDARLVFPIRDARGEVVAFGGRTLEDHEPKYLNSPETDLFHKSRMLYGLDVLGRHRREDPIFVVEGYTDVIVPAQMGVPGIVATLGTALTPEHARILWRYSDRLVLVYDGDKAGLAAAERGGQVLLKGGHLNLQVAVLPEGSDPCDLFLERGPGAMEDILGGARDLVDFLVDRQEDRHDVSSVSGRHQAATQIIAVAAELADGVARELVLQRVAERLRIPLPALTTEALRRQAGRRGQPPPEEETSPLAGSPRALAAQRDVVEALLNRPELARDLDLHDQEIFPDRQLKAVLACILDGIQSGARTTADVLASVPDVDLRALLAPLILEGETRKDLPGQLEGGLACLKNMRDDEGTRVLRNRSLDKDDHAELAAYQERMRSRKGGSRSRTGGGLTAADGRPGPTYQTGETAE